MGVSLCYCYSLYIGETRRKLRRDQRDCCDASELGYKFYGLETLDSVSLLIDFDRAPVARLYLSTWNTRDAQLWSLFDCCDKETREQWLDSSAHLGLHLVVTSEMFAPWSREAKCEYGCKHWAHFFSWGNEHVVCTRWDKCMDWFSDYVKKESMFVINCSVGQQCWSEGTPQQTLGWYLLNSLSVCLGKIVLFHNTLYFVVQSKFVGKKKLDTAPQLVLALPHRRLHCGQLDM